MHRAAFFALWVAIQFTGLLLVAAGAARAAEPAQPIVLDANAKSLKVDRGVELLIETDSERFTAQQVMSPSLAARWAAHSGRAINLPMVDTPVWIRFSVTKPAAVTTPWLAAIEWPSLREVDFHLLDPATGRWGTSYASGLERPRPAGEVQDPSFVFALDLPPGESRTVLLRVRNEGQVSVPLVLWERDEFHAKRYPHAVFMGLLFGSMAAMLLYNLSLYVFTGDRSFLWYCVYVGSVVTYEATVTGYGPYYLWPGFTWLKAHGFSLFACLSFFSASVFFRHFLKLHKGPKHLNLIGLAPIVFWPLFAAVTVPSQSAVTGLIGGLAGLLTLLASVYISAFLAIKGDVLARYFLVAWSAVIAGTMVTLMSQLGVVERGGWVSYAQQIAFALEMVLLSVALAERIKRERARKFAAQRAAMKLADRVEEERDEKIRAQVRALDIQRQATEELEGRVLDRTTELQRAVRNAALANAELSKLSVTDALTRVHNRRYFDETMVKEHARSARTGLPLALVLADIDHFKRINDSLGHLAGDECLKLVSGALQKAVGRPTDLVARFGGEEFAVVLPGTQPEHAMEVAERLRQAVQDIQFTHQGKRVPLSVSLGVVARAARSDEPVEGFLAEADKALYAAKENGRNRVELA